MVWSSHQDRIERQECIVKKEATNVESVEIMKTSIAHVHRAQYRTGFALKDNLRRNVADARYPNSDSSEPPKKSVESA